MQVTLLEILTLFAVLVGPVLAILVSRHLDRSRETINRRMDIFRTLMRTRRTPIVHEHVGALNLIEIEFADCDQVLSAWKKLMEHFGAEHPRRDEEQLDSEQSIQVRDACEARYNERLYNERQRLLAKLLHAIASELGHKAEQLEIFEGGYTPRGWHDDDMEQRLIRQYALDLARGHRVVPVGVVDLRAPNGDGGANDGLDDSKTDGA